MNPRQIPLQKLLLDEENPRLSSTGGGKSQVDLARVLYSEMSVDEVAMSIAENGYFEEEPLIVIPSKKDAGKFVVVEGNRRLAAVRLLTDASLRQRVGASDLPQISASAARALETLPCLVYGDRKELWQFLGFRHINGVKAWDASSKASYIAEVHEKYRVSLDDIAARIGDRHSTVKRLYRGLTVLRQAESTVFNLEDRVRTRFYFSHLYTALDQPEFQNFLGIEPESSLKRNPVPRSNLKELRELMTWLYGNKTERIEPVVRSQNPDLGKLREVISKPAALAALRKGSSLERSHEVSIGDTRRFEDSIYVALESLKVANGLFDSGFRRGNTSLADDMRSIFRQSERLVEQLENSSSTGRKRK